MTITPLILRMIGCKGIEKSMIKLHGMRDEFLQKLVDHIPSPRNSATSSEITGDDQKCSVAETLLSLQESQPEFITDEVVKSFILVRQKFVLYFLKVLKKTENRIKMTRNSVTQIFFLELY